MNARLAPAAVIAVLLAAGSAALAEPDSRIKLRHDPFSRPNLDAPPPPPARAPGTAPETEERLPANMELRGIMIGGGRSMVNVSGKLMSVDDVYEGYRLIRIEERKAVFTRNGAKLELLLAVGGRRGGSGPKDEAARAASETPAISKSDKSNDENPPAAKK
jgi:hypothetical protein